MSLTPRQQFKFGFLLRCADEGLDAEQTRERIKQACDAQMEKQAVSPIRGAADIGELALNAARSLGWYGLGASAVGGLGAGYGMARLTEPEADPEEIKKQELIAAYQQQADRVRRSMMARRYRGDRQAPRGPKLIS